MAIVSSIIFYISPQKDGRIWVEERHTDQLGIVYPVSYLADANADTSTILANRAIQISNDLANAEVQANLSKILIDGSLAIVVVIYATLAQIRAALRAYYQNATKVEAVMLGDFLNTLTNAQLQTLFNITAAAATTLRANKLQPAADLASSIRASTGA